MPRHLLALLTAASVFARPIAAEDRASPPGARADRRGPMITALAWAPDGSGWLRGSQAGVVFHPSSDGRERPIATGLDQVHALAVSPDGAALAIAGGSPAEAGAVELRSWPTGDHRGRLEGHDDVVNDVAWLDRGKVLATAGADRVVRIWDVGTSRGLAELEGHSGPVLALAASPDGRWLCSGGADGTIRVWEVGTWRPVRSLNNHLGPVQGLAFRPDRAEGRPATLASAGGDATVRIWQPAIGRMVRIVRLPSSVLGVAWSRDGSRLLAGSKDGHLRIVDGDSDAILGTRHLADDWITALAAGLEDDSAIVGTASGAANVLSEWQNREPGPGRDSTEIAPPK